MITKLSKITKNFANARGYSASIDDLTEFEQGIIFTLSLTEDDSEACLEYWVTEDGLAFKQNLHLLTFSCDNVPYMIKTEKQLRQVIDLISKRN